MEEPREPLQGIVKIIVVVGFIYYSSFFIIMPNVKWNVCQFARNHVAPASSFLGGLNLCFRWYSVRKNEYDSFLLK